MDRATESAIHSFHLDLVFEDLESQMKPACNSSTTHRLCTCPVLHTSDCSMVGLSE